MSFEPPPPKRLLAIVQNVYRGLTYCNGQEAGAAEAVLRGSPRGGRGKDPCGVPRTTVADVFQSDEHVPGADLGAPLQPSPLALLQTCQTCKQCSLA